MLPVALEYSLGDWNGFRVYRPARGGRSFEHFGGYKTINRIHLFKAVYMTFYCCVPWHWDSSCPSWTSLVADGRSEWPGKTPENTWGKSSIQWVMNLNHSSIWLPALAISELTEKENTKDLSKLFSDLKLDFMWDCNPKILFLLLAKL